MEYCKSCGLKNSGAINGNIRHQELINIIKRHVKDPNSLFKVAAMELESIGCCTETKDVLKRAGNAKILMDKAVSKIEDLTK